MGTYIATADVEARVGQALLAQFVREAAGSSNYEARVAELIARAESRVDAYLGARYTTPVEATGFVEEMALAIAEYEVYRRGSGGAVPEKIREAYEDALADLRAVADGKREIGGATPLATTDAAGIGLVVDAEDAMFDSESMQGF